MLKITLVVYSQSKRYHKHQTTGGSDVQAEIPAAGHLPPVWAQTHIARALPCVPVANKSLCGYPSGGSVSNGFYLGLAVLLAVVGFVVWVLRRNPLDDMQFDVPSDFHERSGRDRRTPVTNSDEAFIGKQRGTERRKS